MNRRLLWEFQQQVLLQCEWVLMAAADVDAGLAQLDTRRVFFGVQSLLTAAANISKALWGQQRKGKEKEKLAKEREPLRASIGIRDDSPLRPTTMRNNYDHFDDRLDKWWRESKGHATVDLSIGSPTAFGLVSGPEAAVDPFDPIDMFRNLDPTNMALGFWGEEFNLQAIVNEVTDLLPKLRAEVNKRPWGP